MNEEFLGKKVQGLVMIDVNPGHLGEVISKLTVSERVSKVYETHGMNDLVVVLNAENLDKMRELIVEIRQIEHISSTGLTTILKVWK